MVKKTKEEQVEVIEENTSEKTKNQNSETFNRFFHTILFALIGWLSLCIFSFVIIIQFGFLIITSQLNHNLKEFNKEVGLFLYDMIKYLSFQTDEKPFPFSDWPYGEESKNNKKSELNEKTTVKVSK